MSPFVRTLAVVSVALFSTASTTVEQAWGQQLEPSRESAPTGGEQSEAKVLILRDGGVLTGTIAQEGETYLISRSGAEIRIPSANVMLVCGSLAEAYELRRARLPRPTAENHLALAEWCLCYNLIEKAELELVEARRYDAGSPRLVLLERRLAQATAASKPLNGKANPTGVVQASATVESAVPKRSDISSAPLPVVERFTRKVQPILVNSCTTSGCHQPGGAQSFQLDRALLHGLANRRTTMTNLAAALALIDRDAPEQSPLLTVPREAHGGMEGPIFGPRQEPVFRHLVEWVLLVTDADSTPSKLRTRLDRPSTPGGVDMQRLDSTDESSLPPVESVYLSAAGHSIDSESQEEPAQFDTSLSEITAERGRLQIGAELRRWQPRDPFDPEIFNREQSRRRGVKQRAAEAEFP